MINCSGRKIRVVSAYYGRTEIFKCGMGLTTNCKASGSGSMVGAPKGMASCLPDDRNLELNRKSFSNREGPDQELVSNCVKPHPFPE